MLSSAPHPSPGPLTPPPCHSQVAELRSDAGSLRSLLAAAEEEAAAYMGRYSQAQQQAAQLQHGADSAEAHAAAAGAAAAVAAQVHAMKGGGPLAAPVSCVQQHMALQAQSHIRLAWHD